MPVFIQNLCASVRGAVRSAAVRVAVSVALLSVLSPVAHAQSPRQILNGLTMLSDHELDSIHGEGLYFRMDMSVEVFNPGDTLPQTVVNTSDPIVIPTSSGTGSTGTGTGGALGGNITLSDNAQSGISSLVNVIGSGSVINVGVNVINIGSSTNDTIYTTNNNVGVFGSSSTPSLQIPVINP